MDIEMKLLKWLGLVVIALAIFFWWRQPSPGPVPTPAELLASRAECGHDLADSVNITQINLIKDVPEFHDCQRFMVKEDKKLRYDVLGAIFAATELSTIVARLGPPLVPPMVPIGIGPGTSITVPSAQTRPSFDEFLAGLMAVVVADAPYDPLGIKAGRNCLYVWHFLSPTPPQVEVWTARMVPKPGATECPDVKVGILEPGTELKVSRAQVPGFTKPEDYPPVARWDWDARDSLQYIGIGCGDAWCEVYKDRLQSSPALPTPNGLDESMRRIRLIKGWYDQQYLATMENGKLVPSNVLGTIMPDPLLGTYTNETFAPNLWVHVADVVLSSTIKKDEVLERYEDKFNFNNSDFKHPGTISLQGSTTPGGPWKAKVKRHRPYWLDSFKGRNITRREATLPGGYKVPGVTRWRWMKTDEGTWTRCSVGCCELSDVTDIPF
jgi:hypothetical protein